MESVLSANAPITGALAVGGWRVVCVEVWAGIFGPHADDAVGRRLSGAEARPMGGGFCPSGGMSVRQGQVVCCPGGLAASGNMVHGGLAGREVNSF